MSLALILIVGGVSLLIATLIARIYVQRIERLVAQREEDLHNELYELMILKQLGERIGYSLDIEQIVDVITASLYQFIEYSAVSYMLLEPERIRFKVHLEKSVDQEFVADVRKRMKNSLSALLDKQLEDMHIEEIVSGAIMLDDAEFPVRSFFNIPLVIAGDVVGVLTIADTKTGLYKEDQVTILYKIIGQASQAVTKLQEVVAIEQRKLNAMVASMVDGVVMVDPYFRVLVINPSAKAIVGKTGHEQTTIFDFIDALEGRFDIHGRLDESMKLGKEYVSDTVAIDDAFFQMMVLPVVGGAGDAQGEVLGGVVIFHNVSDQVKLQEVRDEFTSMLVHELRSPLDSIKKIAQALHGEVIKEHPEKRERYMDMIQKNATQMLQLVNDILDIAKVEAGKFSVQRAPTNPKELVEDVVAFFGPSANERGIDLHEDIKTLSGENISLDEGRMRQVLNNLISNALKFTGGGGSVSVIGTTLEKPQTLHDALTKIGTQKIFTLGQDGMRKLPAGTLIGVLDTGAGIPKAHQQDIFDKFKQLDHTLPHTGDHGTGLGLTVAKGIVEAHGGILDVVSQEGKGSLFYVVVSGEK